MNQRGQRHHSTSVTEANASYEAMTSFMSIEVAISSLRVRWLCSREKTPDNMPDASHIFNVYAYSHFRGASTSRSMNNVVKWRSYFNRQWSVTTILWKDALRYSKRFPRQRLVTTLQPPRSLNTTCPQITLL